MNHVDESKQNKWLIKYTNCISIDYSTVTFLIDVPVLRNEFTIYNYKVIFDLLVLLKLNK